MFISHLDEDHISLITTLKDSVRFIRTVVLPFIDTTNIIVNKLLSQSLGMKEVYEFWSDVYDSVNGYNQSETRFLFVLPQGQDRYNGIRSGESLSLPGISEWVFIPYDRHIDRRVEFEANLEKLVGDSSFQKALENNDIHIETVQDLITKMTTCDFADMIANNDIKKYLKKAYKDITGSINKNSLIVYSGPANGHSFFYPICFFPEIFWCDRDSRHRVACIYTGDSDLDMCYYETVMNSYWEYVGTIQIPHHGSLDSFDIKNNLQYFKERNYICPISCGEKNQYGHPSSRVIEFLLANDCVPHLVTENVSTCFTESIVCH